MPSQLKVRDDLRDCGGTTPKPFFGRAALVLPTCLGGVIHCNALKRNAVLHLSGVSTRNFEYSVYQVLPVSLVFSKHVTSPGNDAVRSH
jgi:hypothetical protein